MTQVHFDVLPFVRYIISRVLFRNNVKHCAVSVSLLFVLSQT